MALKNKQTKNGGNANSTNAGRSVPKGVIYSQSGTQVATNSTQNQNRLEQENTSADDQAIFKNSNVNQNNKEIDYHIELLIDSSDAFDYEDLKNAKYSINDLKKMLIEQIQCFENQGQ